MCARFRGKDLRQAGELTAVCGPLVAPARVLVLDRVDVVNGCVQAADHRAHDLHVRQRGSIWLGPRILRGVCRPGSQINLCLGAASFTHVEVLKSSHEEGVRLAHALAKCTSKLQALDV